MEDLVTFQNAAWEGIRLGPGLAVQSKCMIPPWKLLRMTSLFSSINIWGLVWWNCRAEGYDCNATFEPMGCDSIFIKNGGVLRSNMIKPWRICLNPSNFPKSWLGICGSCEHTLLSNYTLTAGPQKCWFGKGTSIQSYGNEGVHIYVSWVVSVCI